MDWLTLGKVVLGGVGLGYDVWRNRKERRDRINQQNFANQFMTDSRDNAMQIRVDDLRKAGLHPTLAAGATPISPSPSVSPTGGTPLGSSAVQHMLASKQLRREDAEIAKLHAETRNINESTDIIDDDLLIRQNMASIAQQNATTQRMGANTDRMREQRQQDLHETEKLIKETAYWLNLSQDRLNAALADIRSAEANYAQQYSEKMPVTTNQVKHLRDLMDELRLDESQKREVLGYVESGRLGKELMEILIRGLSVYKGR